MSRPKAKREIATKNIRIYPTTLNMLQDTSYSEGKTIARVVHEAIYTFRHRKLT